MSGCGGGMHCMAECDKGKATNKEYALYIEVHH